jgi:arylsulfatase A-like enzyme
MKRRKILAHATLLLLLACPVMPCVGQQRPNMVVVLVDDHAFEAISAYGSYLKDHARTPTIDRLAQEGMRCDSFVCNNSICSPSRAAILTGQYSHTNGVRGLNGRINDSSPQYPVYLQQADYQTWLVGKWHLKNTPKGYDKYMVVKGQGKYFDPGFSGSEGAWKRKGYATDVYTDIAMDWLRKRDRNRPFLLCLQFKAPHHDYGHAERYNELLADVTIPEPSTLYEDVRNSDSVMKRAFLATTKFHMLHSQGKGGGSYYTRHLQDKAPNAMGPHDSTSDRDRIRVAYQHQLHKYIRCVTGNDDNLKRVLDYLDAEKLTEDTVVIYTSDQGYWLGQHGFYDKRLILETSMRMPFLIRYPKLIKPGTMNRDLCMNIDIAPTLLELAGAEIPETMQGRSMVSLLKGKTPSDWRSAQFYTYWGTPNHYGIRTDRYTYVKVAGQTVELYDRKTDPEQRHNVAGQPKYNATIEQLEKELQKQIKEAAIAEQDLPQKKGGSRRSS